MPFDLASNYEPKGAGFCVAVAALALPHAHGFPTDQLLEIARSDDPGRSLGSNDALLSRCYARQDLFTFMAMTFGSGPGNGDDALEPAQQIYYRVTGRPYNSLPAPRSSTTAGFGGIGRLNFDTALGGTRVADKVAGLTLGTLRIDGRVDAAANVS